MSGSATYTAALDLRTRRRQGYRVPFFVAKPLLNRENMEYGEQSLNKNGIAQVEDFARRWSFFWGHDPEHNAQRTHDP